MNMEIMSEKCGNNMTQAHLKGWLLSLLVCNYDKGLWTVEHAHTPAQLFCVTVSKSLNVKPNIRRKLMLSSFRGFTLFWKRQNAQMEISRKLSSSNVKAQQPLGNNTKKKQKQTKNLYFQAARIRQKTLLLL